MSYDPNLAQSYANPVAPQYYAAQPPVNPEKNGFGLAAVILGGVGLVFCLMPLTGFIGIILGFMGIIFALAGMSRVRKNKATNKKAAVTGLVLSVLAFVGGIWAMTLFFSAVNELGDGLDCISDAETTAEIDAC